VGVQDAVGDAHDIKYEGSVPGAASNWKNKALLLGATLMAKPWRPIREKFQSRAGKLAIKG